jgi:hypothetical protein
MRSQATQTCSRGTLCIIVRKTFYNEVDRNLEGVLTLIDDALRNPHPASLREATLPREDAGEGWG